MSSAARPGAGPTGTTALVLGGGGVTGIAWEIGVLHGLRAAGGALAVALDAPALVVGTSAGSVVGTMVAAAAERSERWDLEDAWAAQHGPASSEVARAVDLEGLLTRMADPALSHDPVGARQVVGAYPRGRLGHRPRARALGVRPPPGARLARRPAAHHRGRRAQR
jgi:NTE family protein